MTRQRTVTTTPSTQQQSANQVHPDFASVESIDGVQFSNGNMMVYNTPQLPVEAQQWQSSNGLTTYTTVKWRDPQTGDHRVSRNCTGWAMKKSGKPRRCKHTDDMMGIKTCSARRINGVSPVPITTLEQAESLIEQFDGRPLRGFMLD